MGIIRTLSVLLVAITACWTEARPQCGLVKIDSVTGAWGPNSLLAGYVHRVYIRYDFSDCSPAYNWWIANAFEIYSLEGADWGYLKGSDGPLVQALSEGVVRIRKHVYRDSWSGLWKLTGGQGRDSAGPSGGTSTRAGYCLSTLSSDWPPEGFVGGTDNGIAMILEFTTVHSDEGRTICLDTVQFNGTPAWEWPSASTCDYPRWDNGLGVSGPRCWDIYVTPCVSDRSEDRPASASSQNAACNTCCDIHVGDANNSGQDMPTLADVAALIDAKFITNSCTGVIHCLEEADINKSAGGDTSCDDITLADVSMLVDYLFISGPANMALPECY